MSESPVLRSAIARRRVRGRTLLLAMVGVVAAAIIPLVIVLLHRPPDPKLEDKGEITGFSLVDERGQTFTQDAMRGNVTIVGFLFTRCDTICPQVTARMAQVQDKTFDRGDRIKLVSFSVDPVYDTPERLAAYAKTFKADPERWRFVTGPFDRIHDVIEHQLITSMLRNPDKPSGIPDIVHAGYFLLVDPALHIRGRYDSKAIDELDTMIRDARYLARTMR